MTPHCSAASGLSRYRPSVAVTTPNIMRPRRAPLTPGPTTPKTRPQHHPDQKYHHIVHAAPLLNLRPVRPPPR